jgi:hypothetical protein
MIRQISILLTVLTLGSAPALAGDGTARAAVGGGLGGALGALLGQELGGPNGAILGGGLGAAAGAAVATQVQRERQYYPQPVYGYQERVYVEERPWGRRPGHRRGHHWGHHRHDD